MSFPVWSVCVTVVAVLLQLPLSPVQGNKLVLWHHFRISSAKITDIIHQRDSPNVLKVAMYGSTICRDLVGCAVWCHFPSGTYIFSTMIIFSSVVETNLDDIIDCYTTRGGELASTATITGTPAFSVQPWRVKEKLVDGIYSQGDWYSGEKDQDQWIMLDFGKVVPISRVLIFAQENQNANVALIDFEVRVGTSPVVAPGGLSDYDLFGKFPGEASPSQIIVFESPKPVQARYLSIQKFNTTFLFTIAHLEIY